LRWMSGPTALALLRANIMFDFRALYGDALLVDELRSWLNARSPHEPLFLRQMAQNALEVAPPLGVLRPFVTDDDRDPKGTLDLKGRGTRLFVDAARLFALAFAMRPTDTVTRLREAGHRLNLDVRQVDAIVEAFLFLQMLRLRQQDFAVTPTDPNRLAPDTLNEVDRRMLKEAFRQARALQDLVRGRWPL
jgi:CBS domain-containing protein